jgi:hypothetical protein
VTSTRYWWSPGKQCRRSSVRPAVTQRGETRDFGLKTPRLTLGLKFRSDKTFSKWPPEAVAAPHPGRKMSPLCSTSGGSETCCASDPWRAPSSIHSNLVCDRLNLAISPSWPTSNLREHGAWNISTAKERAPPSSPSRYGRRQRRLSHAQARPPRLSPAPFQYAS